MQRPVRSARFRTPDAPTITSQALHVHERAVRAYQAASASLPAADIELRKARALSQDNSALERLVHQMIRMRLLGATIADLRAIPLMLETLLDDLASPAARGRMLALLRENKSRQHDACLAELDSFANVGNARELHRLADAMRSSAAVELEVANEAEREAQQLEGMRA